MGSMVLQILDAQDINSELPGLGVKSHYGVTCDLVPIGSSVLPTHDELLVINLCLISSQTGKAYSPMSW